MKDVKYVIRFFKDDKYSYSIHCDASILDDLVSEAKVNGYSVKIVAYDSDSKSEV